MAICTKDNTLKGDEMQTWERASELERDRLEKQDGSTETFQVHPSYIIE